jgi:SAM-dependent methyltransferase
MKNQDFEAYAEFKQFNLNIAATWDYAFSCALEMTGHAAADVQLLDYGCGDGKYFKYLVDRGLHDRHIHGLEISEKRLVRCRQLGWENTRQLVAQAPLPYDDSSFDIINCMEVIEHIPAKEGRRVVGELRRVLRTNGVLMISTPNYPMKRFYDWCDAVLYGKWSRLRDDPTHVTHFNHERLKCLLGQHFRYIEPWPFKPGFLYKHIPRPAFLHKLFFLCRP